MMKIALLTPLIFTLLTNSCSDLLKEQSKQPQGSQQENRSCITRYAPVGNNPEVALDTQTGTLCRTIADINDPLGVRDPACGVTEQMKKLDFVPIGCKGGQTWVKAEGKHNPSSYRDLPACSSVIVVTPNDMKQAEGK